jgi:phospholipase C
MNPSALLGLLAFAAAIVAAPQKSRPTPGSPQSIRNLKDKIKNVVLITMENRSVDNLLGGQKIRGLENPINNGPFCNPVNLTNPHAGIVCSQPKDFDSVAEDPDHSIPGNNIEFYSTFEPDNAKIAAGTLTPTMQGFVHEQIRQNPTGDPTVAGIQVMNFYTEDQVPVITELTQQFVTFNDWFSGVPGVSKAIQMQNVHVLIKVFSAYGPQQSVHTFWDIFWTWHKRRQLCCHAATTFHLPATGRDKPHMDRL